MFGWLTDRRRARLLEEPFPAEWNAIIDDNVALAARLDAEQRRRLCELVQVFVAEKSWEGCGGLEMTDEVKVTIAAQACMLLIGREHALYEDVESILVYPDTVVAPPRKPSFFEPGTQPIDERGVYLLAWSNAPSVPVSLDGREAPQDGLTLYIIRLNGAANLPLTILPTALPSPTPIVPTLAPTPTPIVATPIESTSVPSPTQSP